MNIGRAAVLGVGGGALAAWLAAASTSGPRAVVPPVQPRAAAVEKSGAELADEIARLHDRLHPTATPAAPSRNLFDFATVRAGHVDTAPAAPLPEPVRAAPPAPEPAITLLGIADDNGVRTAILSNGGQVLLVKEGEAAGDAFTVTHIDQTAVELAASAPADSRTLRLALK